MKLNWQRLKNYLEKNSEFTKRKTVFLALAFVAVVLFSNIISSYQYNIGNISLTIESRNKTGLSLIKVYEVSLWGKVSELEKSGVTWNHKKGKRYAAKIWVSLPQNEIENIKEVRVDVVKKTFKFSNKDAAKFKIIDKPEPAVDIEGNTLLELPGFVRSQTSLFYKILLIFSPVSKNIINWGGDLPFLNSVSASFFLFFLFFLFFFLVRKSTRKQLHLKVIGIVILFNYMFLYNFKQPFSLIIVLIISAISYLVWRNFSIRSLNVQYKERMLKFNFWFCLLSVVFITYIFNMQFYNKFFPLTEGWWSVVAYYINHGKLPYRDFYLCLPPLYPYQIAAFSKIFGYDFIHLRELGVMVMVLFSCGIYGILIRFFPYFISAILAIVATLVTQSFPFLVNYDFNILISLYSVYLILFFLCAVDNAYNLRKRNLFYILSGITSALIFLTKQNAGPIIIFASLCILFVDSVRFKKKSFLPIGLYTAGLVAPILITVFWLLKNNILSDFFQQVFSDAVNSKGRISLILFQWVANLFTGNRILGISLFAGIIFVFLNARLNNPMRVFEEKFTEWNRNIKISILTIFPFFMVVIMAYCFNKYSLELINNRAMVFFISTMLPISLTVFISIIVFYCCYVIFYKKINSQINQELFYFSVLSLAIVFYATTSARDILLLTLFMPFVFFFGFIFFYDSKLNLIKPLIYSTLIITAWYASAVKYNIPYQWFGDEQLNIHESVCPSKVELLKGFYLSKDRERYLNEICSVIIDNSGPNDSIFVFPHYPVLYLMTRRFPPTLALFHWIDVVSDRICKADAQKLLEHPPKIIICEFNTIGIQESLFRDGKESGQRNIINAIESMVKQNKYRLIKEIANFKIFKRVE